MITEIAALIRDFPVAPEEATDISIMDFTNDIANILYDNGFITSRAAFMNECGVGTCGMD